MLITIVKLALAFVPWLPAWQLQEPKHETWTDLAETYELAFMAWAQEMNRTGAWDKPDAERPPSPAIVLWSRFETLADQGEGRAVLWMLRNVQDAPGVRREVLEKLFGRVREGRDAEWVGVAIHVLAERREEIDRADFERYLASKQLPEVPMTVRVAAMLQNAGMVEQENATEADELRMRAAFLRWKDADLSVGELPGPELLEELTVALLEGVKREEGSWFQTALRKGDDGGYYSRADYAPSPKDIWRPVIETLANRGSSEARLWVLTKSWPQEESDERKAVLRRHLDGLARDGISAESLKLLGWYVGPLVEFLGADFVEPRVRKLADQANEEDRPQFLLGLGEGLCETAADEAQRERGLDLLRKVQESWPESGAGKLVEGRIFRYTSLLVGKRIPDFESEDVEGTAFKLSDYAGKVTVIDFWGFW